MDDSLQARIEHEIADLRARYPRITYVRAALEDRQEGFDRLYALRLDIRLPQHQSLVSGGAQNSAYPAVRAAFDAAFERMAALAARSARMLCLEDCLALCDPAEDEVLAIAQHEHIPEIFVLQHPRCEERSQQRSL